MKPFPIHPVVNLFPPLEGDDLDDLARNIEDHGVLEPVWIFNGQLIDGRNRQTALAIANRRRKETGRSQWPLPSRDWHGQGSLVEFVISLNLHRRHLTTSQRAMLGTTALPMIEEEAHQRQKAALKAGAQSPLAQYCANGENKAKNEKSSEVAARLVGVGHRTMENAKKVKEEGGEELVKAVREGKLTVNAAVQRLKDGDSPTVQREKLERQRAAGERGAAAVRLRDALGKGAGHLEDAKRSLEKAAKVLHGYDAKKTLKAIEHAQECLATDAARLLAAAERVA